jgi:hypothetical protein
LNRPLRRNIRDAAPTHRRETTAPTLADPIFDETCHLRVQTHGILVGTPFSVAKSTGDKWTQNPVFCTRLFARAPPTLTRLTSPTFFHTDRPPPPQFLSSRGAHSTVTLRQNFPSGNFSRNWWRSKLGSTGASARRPTRRGDFSTTCRR